MQKQLRKILEELNKEKPDTSYIRGMLEVLIDEDSDSFLITDMSGKTRVTTNEKQIAKIRQDEASIMDAETKAKMQAIDPFIQTR